MPLICGVCSESVENAKQVVIVDAAIFHKACFKCSQCLKSSDGFYGVEKGTDPDSCSNDNKGHKYPYCGACFGKLNKTKRRCDGCKHGFKWNDMILSANNTIWHEECFKCIKCQKRITHEYLVHEEKAYCSMACRPDSQLSLSVSMPTTPLENKADASPTEIRP